MSQSRRLLARTKVSSMILVPLELASHMTEKRRERFKHYFHLTGAHLAFPGGCQSAAGWARILDVQH